MSRRSHEHVGLRNARLYYGVAGGGFVATALTFVTATSFGSRLVFTGIFFSISAFVVHLARGLSRYGIAATLIGDTTERIAKGNLDEAEAEIKKLKKRSWANRTVGLLEATIAIARGDVDLALRAIEPATTAGRGLLQSWEEELRVEALSLRAFARAAKGEADSALADVMSVETHPNVRPPALARVALARALVLKEGSPELTAHLQSSAGLILEHGGARERLLFRALRGLSIHAVNKAVYREPARAAEDEPGINEDANAAWILRLAPHAARYAPSANTDEDDDEKEDEEASFTMHREGLRAIADSRRAAIRDVKSERKIWKAFLAVGGGLATIVGFLYATTFIPHQPLPDDPKAPLPPPTLMEYLAPLLVVAIAVVAIGALIKWGRNLARKSAYADRAVLAGNDDQASKLLTEISAIPNLFVAERVFAHARLAMLATRRGDFEAALKECDYGTGLATLGAFFKLTDVEYFPTLLSERAFVLAALGRLQEAETEMATVASSYPNFSAMSRAAFRVRLMVAVKAGDLSKAASLARSRSQELAIDLRTELLADAVLVKSNLVKRTEAARIRGELEAAPDHLQAWVRSLLGDLTAEGPSASASARVVLARVAAAEEQPVEERLEERIEVLDRDLRRLHL